MAYPILILSILVQITATALAVRLVWTTGKIWAWMFVAAGITLMAVRRGSTLYYGITQGLTFNLSTEIIALISSGLLLLGLSLIGPLFVGLKRHADQSLMQSEEKYRLLALMVPAVVYRGYSDGTLDLFDDKVAEVMGYDKEMFNSRQLKWPELIFPEDREAVKAVLLQAVKGNKS